MRPRHHPLQPVPANYVDLQAAFGTNTEAATLHYITNGYFEGRTDRHLA